MSRIRTRHRTKPLGILHPDCLYTKRGLMKACGIGEMTLSDIRAQGVRPREFGGRDWYSGSEIIELILGKAKKAK